jgi:hypothetical protein
MSFNITQTPIFGTSNSSISIGTNSGIISTISGSSLTIGMTSYTRKFHVLGEDFDLSNNSGFDSNLVIIISTLNVLGRPFWEELKKQNVYLPEELKDFIEERLVILDRDNKINSIIKD